MAYDGIGATDRRLLEAELEEERRIAEARLAGGCAKFVPAPDTNGYGHCTCDETEWDDDEVHSGWECICPIEWEPA